MPTKRSHEGYLIIDHRNSPGISGAMVNAIDASLPLSAGHGFFESATYTCSHCTRIVIMNPLRTRERGYCPACDHYVCDLCESVRLVKGCKTFKQIVEEIKESAAQAEGIKEI